MYFYESEQLIGNVYHFIDDCCISLNILSTFMSLNSIIGSVVVLGNTFHCGPDLLLKFSVYF